MTIRSGKDAILQASVGQQKQETRFVWLVLKLGVGRRYPEVDSLVMVQVKQIQEMGAYVKLVSSYFAKTALKTMLVVS